MSRPALPSKLKPGAPVNRAPTSARSKEKTLERVLTKERMRRSMSRSASGTIALLRSASVTTIPGLKREASEPLLSMIPKGEPPKSRPPLFSTGATVKPVDDPKARKKAQVEAELRDAISALKKPNRALAVKELADAADKRSLPATSQPKSSTSSPLSPTPSQLTPPPELKKQSRLPSSIQVKATPANNRFKDVLATTSATAFDDDDNIPSSSMIPASTVPRKFANLLHRNTSSAPVSIQATPARASRTTSMFPPPPTRNDDPPSSPIMARRAVPAAAARRASPGGILETPVPARTVAAAVGAGSVVDDTPIKGRLFGSSVARGGLGVVAETPERKGGKEREREVDIYQQLGWDMGDFDDI